MKLNKKKLVCAMVHADMTNEKLSLKSGISVTRISNIRNGAKCTYETICKIANALNVPILELVDDDTAKNLTFMDPVECIISQMMKRTDISEEDKKEIAFNLRSKA